MFFRKSGKTHTLVLILGAAIVVLIFCIIVLRKRQNHPRIARKIILELEKTPPAPSVAPAPTITSAPTPGTHARNIPTTTTKAILGPCLMLTGRVSLQDGSPAANAIVRLVKPGWGKDPTTIHEKMVGETIADLNGHYRLVVRDNVYFSLSAEKKGYAKAGIVLWDKDAAEHSGRQTGTRKVAKDLVLFPAAPIRGKVIDETNKPVKGAKIYTMPAAKKGENFHVASASDTTTDKYGLYTLENVTPGKWILSVYAAAYVPFTKVVEAPADNVILRVSSRGAVLEGHIYLKLSGEAVPHASVQLSPQLFSPTMLFASARYMTETNETGEYRFEHLAAGKYDIDASKHNLHLMPSKKGTSYRFTLAVNEEKTNFDLYVYSGHTIRGKVKDVRNGKPLDSVTVSTGGIYPVYRKNEYETGADGKYILTGVFGPLVDLKVQKKDYRAIRSVTAGEIQIRLDPEQLDVTQDIEMAPAVTVSGIVKTADGIPVANAKVSASTNPDVFRYNKFTPVDDGARFALEVTPFQPTRIQAKAPGYCIAYSHPLDVKDIPISDVEIILKRGATVKGIVVNPDGEPVEGATVQASQFLGMVRHLAGQRCGEADSDAEGKFVLSNLPPEGIRLVAREKGFTASRGEKIILSPGEIRSGIKLALRKSHYLAGQVTDIDRNPLEGVTISAYANVPGMNSNGYARTDADGNYRIEGLAKVAYTVRLYHNEYGNKSYRRVEVDRDDADFVLSSKEKVKLIGSVVDWKSGEPIGDFTVTSDGSIRPGKVSGTPGRFIAKNLEPGLIYGFRIKASGYANLEAEMVTITKGKDVIEHTFKMGPGGSILGRVVSSGQRQPLSGVHVYLKGVCNEWEVSSRLPEAIAITETDGRFQFDNVPVGKNTVVFAPPAPLAGLTRRIDVQQGSTSDFGDVGLWSGSTLKGKVVQMPGEKGVPGERIKLRDFAKGTVQTREADANGEFEFTALKNGHYVLSLDQYKVFLVSINLDGIETREVVLKIGARKLKGLVLRKRKPAQANIILTSANGTMSRTTTADADGVFEIHNLTPGRWLVLVSLMDNWKLNVSKWVDIEREGITEKTFVIPSGRLVGEVLDTDGAPVTRAKISAHLTKLADEEYEIDHKTYCATSDSDGTFAIEGPPPGTYRVSAYEEKAGSASVQGVKVPVDGDSDEAILRLGATGGGTLISVALNLTNGEPIKDAWCYISTSEGNFYHGQKRNDDGVLHIPNILAGTYVIDIGAVEFSSAIHVVKIKPGETVKLEDALYEFGEFSWKLVDKNGTPQSNIPCWLTPNDPDSIENILRGETNQNGLWNRGGLYPGEYTATATMPDGSQVTEIIIIKPHETTKKETIVE